MAFDMTFIPQDRISKSTFGDDVSMEFDAQVAIKAVYNILDNTQTFTATGGSVAATNSEFVLQTGTSSGGYGALWSHLPIVYSPGIGGEARITARFTAGVASSLQACGLFSAADGMFFGYNGTSFGIMHRHHGEFEVRTLTVNVAAGGAETVTVTLNGVAYTASVTAGTTKQNAHEIETGLSAGAAASIWHIQHIGSTIVFVGLAIGSKSGSYSVSSTGALAGTIAQTKAGAAATETWTAQASWNIDTASWLDPTKGNLYRLEFAYLGYGPLVYSIFHPTRREWARVHVIDWPNANTGTNIGNPSMRVGWVSASLGSTTNLTVAGASAMAGLQGIKYHSRSFGGYGTATGVTTETQVLTVQVRREFGGRACNAILKPMVLSIGTDSNKGAIFRVLRNPTVSGTTAHAYVDQTESIALTDTAGTTVSGGRLLGVYSVGPSGRATISLADQNMYQISGDELVITAQVTSGAASEMTASLVWEERE